MTLTPKNLFLAQVIAHLSLITMFFYASFFEWAISIFVYFLTGCVGGSMGYHRLLSHRSWKTSPFAEKLITLLSTVGLSGSAISWVSTHRKHHKFVDTEKDPHSPSFKGFLKMHYMSMFESTDIKYASDLIRNDFYRFQHKYYFEINFVWAFIVVILFQDFYALVYAWLAPAAILWTFTSCIITISHRNKFIHNDIILSLLVWGEGYHHNHHRNPEKYRFGKYDVSGKLIELFKKNEIKI